MHIFKWSPHRWGSTADTASVIQDVVATGPGLQRLESKGPVYRISDTR